jgi:hypothetical protein
MDLQQQSANALVDALLEHHVASALASRADGYLVSTQARPNATVHFGYDQLRGLLVQFTFDNDRPPVRLDYLPTPAGTAALAQFVVDKIAGEGGRPPTRT